jgi:hypothetical protein
MSSYSRGAAARSLWQKRLSSFEASGLSVKKFCEGETSAERRFTSGVNDSRLRPVVC